ncbi:hypothetical protein NTGZN8_110008 [Candidatus Nitrotoga fabula]|uniref:Uncharacterized protein n=1 Tax=Candidatus Nitrotoga fabula TaxID=2182327 RepID=A0A916FB10_9PROT|nr:hypothetical protein NTGZN8_110008 [Candidatus Nitrotoga fabula]
MIASVPELELYVIFDDSVAFDKIRTVLAE